MKNLKLFVAAIITTLIIVATVSAKAEISDPSTNVELKSQIQKEMFDVLNSEITLYFKDKFLDGQTYITLEVADNGKIIIKNISGDNNSLNSLIEKRFLTKNLWTDTKFKGKTFTYKIVYNNQV